jgi:hypothetical protein
MVQGRRQQPCWNLRRLDRVALLGGGTWPSAEDSTDGSLTRGAVLPSARLPATTVGAQRER